MAATEVHHGYFQYLSLTGGTSSAISTPQLDWKRVAKERQFVSPAETIELDNYLLIGAGSLLSWRGRLMVLHLTAHFFNSSPQQPLGRVKGIPNGDVNISMGLIPLRVPINKNILPTDL